MRDTRLTNMRESLAAAVTATDKQAKWLLLEAQKLVEEISDDGPLEIHDRVDLLQIASFLGTALGHVQAAVLHMESASRELWQMEVRA